MSNYNLIVQKHIDRSKIKKAQYTQKEILRFEKVSNEKMLAFEKLHRKLPNDKHTVKQRQKIESSELYNTLLNFLIKTDLQLTIAELGRTLELPSNSKINYCLMRMVEAGIIQKDFRKYTYKNRTDNRYVYYV